jgi:hypothetical protein
MFDSHVPWMNCIVRQSGQREVTALGISPNSNPFSSALLEIVA